MDLFQAIADRYSYRGAYKEGTILRGDLEKIVQAGLDVPSGCNAQTTTFIIVDEPDLVKQIGSISMKAMNEAKAFICCINDVDAIPVYQKYDFQKEDCAAAVENMLLAITALGYASVWIDGSLRVENRAEVIGQLLAVPAGKIIRVILPVGIPAEEGPRKEKKSFSERAWFNHYPRSDK